MDAWNFNFSPSEEVALSLDGWSSLILPHTWNAADGSQNRVMYRRGVGYYQRRVALDPAWRNRSVFLTVGAANAKAVVSLNGQPILEHRTGFTAFTANLTPHLRWDAPCDLQLVVDNRASLDYPPIVSDYTFFGGIYRPVWLTITDPLHISLTHHSSPGVYLVQRQVSAARAEIDVQVEVANDHPVVMEAVTVSVDVLDHLGVVVATVTNAPIATPASSQQRVVVPVTLTNPRLWNGRDDPYCYTARVRIHHGGRVTDQVEQPLGLRFFRVDPDLGFILNGKQYPLHGMSLHQDRAGKGWAISQADREQDIGLVQELGATCVRLVHYPHAPATIDLLDRAGIVCWSEIPIAYRLGTMPAFGNNCQTMLTEMIHQLYNHPSICFWGLFNEFAGLREENHIFMQSLNTLAKELDPTRLTTGAAGALEDDPNSNVTDVIAFNRYFGWYIPGMHLFAPWADSAHALHPQRSIGLAEFGADGDHLRHNDLLATRSVFRLPFDAQMGTEEYQTRLHEVAWAQIKDRRFLWCKLGWTLADWSRGGIRPPTAFPSAGIGRQGLVSHDRQIRKDAFHWYKANWSREPVLHICERRFNPRPHRGIDLTVYWNQELPLVVSINGMVLEQKPEREGVRYCWRGVVLPVGAVTVLVDAVINGQPLRDAVTWEVPDLLPPPPPKPKPTAVSNPPATPNPDF